jgi:hypothetical protein
MDTGTTRWTSGTDGQPVAAYDTPHGAELAVERLTAEGFAPDAIAIRPVAAEPLPGWRARTRHHQGSAGFAVATTAVASAIVAMAATALGWSLAAIVIAVGAAAGIGALAHAAIAWHAARASQRARTDRRVIARAFEIRCRVDPARARRILARWWDPVARPAAPDS